MLNIEESQLQADGRTVHLLTNKVPLLDATGQVTGMLGIYMDITKRKQAETTLRKSEAWLQTLFDSVVEYIFVIDPEGQIIKVNRYVYEQSGYKADEVIGRNIKELFSEDSKDICDRNFPTLRERGYNRAEVEFVCKDGRVIQMECSATAVPDENGDFSTFLIVQRDVTDKKRAEEERQYHHQEMAHVIRLSTAGEMASGMAHELNQPLTALISYCGTAVSLVNSMSSPPQQLGEILERATEQALRAGEIIRHLREFVSKGDNNQESLDIDRVIRDIIIFIKHEVQESDVKIIFHPGSQTCRIKANKIQIEQVLINMVRNSLEAIRNAEIAEGQIVLQSRMLSNELVKVTVTDNGPGINPAMVDTLFHPFQTTKKTGMGIGLSLSRTIIETHGGKLWVDKDYENGALFAFELPVIN
jgi:two-component system sensor kinase FixL